MKLILTLVFLFGSVCSAQDAAMTRFLRCSFYGTIVGAGVGLASLAFAENPEKKMNSIARGASLGLYAGMAWGAFGGSSYSGSSEGRSDDYGQLYSAPAGFVSVVPDMNGKLAIQTHWTLLHF